MELRLLTTKPRPSPTAAAAWPLAAHVLALVALFRLALERHVRPVNGAHAFRERAPKPGSWDPCLRLADKQPAKCEVAHTSPPLARGTRTGTGTTRLLEPGGVHGTKTS